MSERDKEGAMKLSERLRDYTRHVTDGAKADLLEAANAVDALDAQEKRIKALEGALRKVVDEWDNDYCVDYADVIEDTRALLGEK